MASRRYLRQNLKMQSWRIISEDGKDSRIITGQGQVFPYQEIDKFVREHYFGHYKIQEIKLDK